MLFFQSKEVLEQGEGRKPGFLRICWGQTQEGGGRKRFEELGMCAQAGQRRILSAKSSTHESLLHCDRLTSSGISRPHVST